MSDPGDTSAPFRVAYAEGVTPGKWLRIWNERFPTSPLDATLATRLSPASVLGQAEADMAFVRLPFATDGLHAIRLYEEVPVVVLSKDHPLAERGEVDLADLSDEPFVVDPNGTFGWPALGLQVVAGLPELTMAHAVEGAAMGTGLLMIPASIARLHRRKDVVALPVLDLPPVPVALVWDQANDDPRIENFIGVVRGRTERSSRQADAPVKAKPTAKAKQAAKAKQSTRERAAVSRARGSRRR